MEMNGWKDFTKEKPKIGKWYVCVDTRGRYLVRQYTYLVFCYPGTISKRIKRLGTYTATQLEIGKRNGEIVEGFVGNNAQYMSKNIIYYHELPELPHENKKRLEATLKIKQLEKKIEELKAEIAEDTEK